MLNKNQPASLHRRIWTLSGPMMLSNLSWPLLGLVDTAVMGHLDSAVYLAAVTVGSMIIHFLFWAFGFLRMATVGLAAQAYGAGNGTVLRSQLIQGSIVALSIALILIVLQFFIFKLSFMLVKPGAEIQVLAQQYMDIRIWAAPASLLTYVLLGWFLGIQQARAVLLVMVFVNVLNIVLDFVFVIGLKMQVDGVAWATLLSEYSGLILALYIASRQLKNISGHFVVASIFNAAAFKRLARLNSDIFIRTTALLFAFGFFTAQGARSGDVVVAGNAILLQFITLMAYVLDAYAHAAEALVGEAIGDKNRDKLQRAVKACLHWSLASSLVFALFYISLGNWVIALLTDIETIRQFSSDYLIWMAFLPLIAVWSYLYDGVFVGATWSRQMRDVMLVAVILVYLPVWYLSTSLGNHGLWLALFMFFVARGTLMTLSYRRQLQKFTDSHETLRS